MTGGCGFIGSHLADALIARGDRVRVLDDLSTGRVENAPAAAELVRGDVADAGLVARAMADVDGCFHLAAIASVERGRRDWLGSHRVNLTATIGVFDAARQARRQPVPVVYASSAAVYGDNPAIPLGEDAVAQPLSAYGADKFGCELHARVASTLHGVPTFGLRFFNVYGPRQDPGSPYSGVISIFCDRLRRGETVTIFGDGEQARDFIYVADVVAALEAAMAALASTPAVAPAVANVCTGQPTSINALVHQIAALCGAAPAVERAPARAGDIRRSIGDPGRARRQLGLAAPTPLSVGLARTLDPAP